MLRYRHEKRKEYKEWTKEKRIWGPQIEKNQSVLQE